MTGLPAEVTEAVVSPAEMSQMAPAGRGRLLIGGVRR